MDEQDIKDVPDHALVEGHLVAATHQRRAGGDVQAGRAAVVDREDIVLGGLHRKGRAKLTEFLRVGVGQVLALGGVVLHVVQLPVVYVCVCLGRWVGGLLRGEMVGWVDGLLTAADGVDVRGRAHPGGGNGGGLGRPALVVDACVWVLGRWAGGWVDLGTNQPSRLDGWVMDVQNKPSSASIQPSTHLIYLP